MEGIGEGKVLPPEQQRRVDLIRERIEERKQGLLARLEETEDPEEKRAIEEELARLPGIIVSMQTYNGYEVA